MRQPHRTSLAITAVLFGALLLPTARAQSVSPSESIVQMLQASAQDWTRGDLNAFASTYKNSPDILFMGRTIRHGFDGMLAGYRKSFPTREAMGQLSFTELAVQPLDERFATVTGRFHLQRTAAGGGDRGGYFLLVVEDTSAGWKIVRDDTTADGVAKH